MNEISQLPAPQPEVPQGALWTALSLPPVATIVANLILSSVGENLQGVSGWLLLMLFVVFIVILMFTIRFHEIVSRRYQGRSLVFLTFAYFFGQILICLALWIGSCALFMPHLH